KSTEAEVIFKTYSLGVSTNRDSAVYDFGLDELSKKVKEFSDVLNMEVLRYQQAGRPKDLDSFLRYDSIKWSRNLKRDLKTLKRIEFNEKNIRSALYRPFSKKYLYFADVII